MDVIDSKTQREKEIQEVGKRLKDNVDGLLDRFVVVGYGKYAND